MNRTIGRTRRDVVSVVDDAHRDLQVARDACAGRFTHAGTTLRLGTRPDWLASGTADEEWRIEWVKLYEGLHLAHAFEQTVDRRYPTTWTALVESFCEQVPVGHDTSDVTARRLQNWLYAWQRFESVDPESVDDTTRDLLRARIARDAAHLADHLTAERNHRTMELYTLLLVGIAFDDEVRAQRALELLADNAAADILDDGVQRERSSDYHMIVLRSLVGAVLNARSAGLRTPATLVDRTHRACTFGLHLQRPDGTTPALSDGDQGDFRPLLRLAASVLDRPDLAWAASDGSLGSAPKERMATFGTGGYAIQRSGWGDRGRHYVDERWAVLDCGPLGDGGHGHYDHLSVEMMADGRRLVVDPGRYTYDADDADWRHRFKGTAAHNTVCVDGLDQTTFHPGKPKGAVSGARLVARHTQPGLDVVTAETRSPNYDAVHVRSLALVADSYWIVVDELTGEQPHEYVARWHLDPELTLFDEPEERATLTTVRTVGASFSFTPGRLRVEHGWVSPDYGVKTAAPILAVGLPKAASGLLTTVVVPGRGAPLAVTTVREAETLTTVVRFEDAVDTVRWSERSARRERRSC